MYLCNVNDINRVFILKRITDMQISISKEKYQSKNTIEFATIVFTTIIVNTINEIAYLLKKGYVLAHVFKCENNTFTIKEKNKNNFIQTNLVIFDIDESDISLEEAYEKLSVKPSIAYTTFNNGIKGFRYRYIFAFKHEIISEVEYKTIYLNLKKKLGIVGDDSHCSNFTQMFFGNPSENAIYLVNESCILNKNDYLSPIEIPNTVSKKNKFININDIEINPIFKEDLFNMEIEDFLKKYCDNFHYHQRYKPTFNEDEIYQLVNPSEEYKLFAKYHLEEGKLVYDKYLDGERRKYKLFINGLKIFHKEFKSKMSIEHLIFVLLSEVYLKFDNSDETFTPSYLIKTANKIIISENNLKDEPCSRKFVLNPKFMKSCSKQLLIGYILKKIKDKEILKQFDKTKTVNENLKHFNSIGLKVSKQTLYNVLERNGINPKKSNKRKKLNDDWKHLIDVNISTKENLKTLEKNGFSISRQTVSTYLNKLKKSNNNNAEIMENKEEELIPIDTIQESVVVDNNETRIVQPKPKKLSLEEKMKICREKISQMNTREEAIPFIEKYANWLFEKGIEDDKVKEEIKLCLHSVVRE